MVLPVHKGQSDLLEQKAIKAIQVKLDLPDPLEQLDLKVPRVLPAQQVQLDPLVQKAMPEEMDQMVVMEKMEEMD